MLIESGDTVMFCNDIPHAGAENLTDQRNFIPHYFMTVDNWNLPLKIGLLIEL